MRALVVAFVLAAADASRAVMDLSQDLDLAMETIQQQVDEAVQGSSDDVQVAAVEYIKVATLNALAKAKCSPSLASFPTVSQETVHRKAAGWLTGVLNSVFKHGVDFIAVQESDEADVAASAYAQSGACVTWVDPPPGTGDPQHLCWNPEKFELSDRQSWQCGRSNSMQGERIPCRTFCACNFTSKADPGRSLMIMGAHATPTFAEAYEFYPTIRRTKPDVFLMDANQYGSEAMKALGGDYSIVFPGHDSTTTTIKSAFKYRKLYQAFEGTCKVSRKCTADEQGFENLPNELNTCKLLLESGKCGDMSGKDSEALWKEVGAVCKYASRVCGEYDEDVKLEMDAFLATHPSVPSRGAFDLKRIRSLLWGDGPTPEDTVTKKDQEDVIIFKNDYRLITRAVFPGTDNEEFMAQGKKTGFPNEVWPSDHFLVSAALKI